MSSAAQDLVLLRDRVAEVFERHGLDLWQIIFVPDSSEGLEFHAFAGLAQDEVPTTDDGFDEVIRSAQQADTDQRTQRSIEELTQRLRKDGGFLDF